jgi:hypothetical protein
MLQVMESVFKYTEPEKLQSFFHEAVVSKDRVPLMTGLFRAKLLYEGSLNSFLSHIIHFFGIVFVHMPSVIQVRFDKSSQDLVQCLQSACQRQICRGASDEETNKIIGSSLGIIGCLLPLL